MKKLFVVTMAAAVIFISSAAVMANDDIGVYLDGEGLSFDVPPQIMEDYTFVPMRAVFEAFDMTVDWNADTQTVTAQGSGGTVTMTVGDNRIFKNGNEIRIDVSARIVGDRTLVPVRAVSESLDCEVKWDGDDRKVNIISSPDKVIGTATIENMRCLIDYQPIDFVNIDGYTYLKATDLDKYGFDVTEENGDIYIKRNKDKLPLLIDEYKNGLVRYKWFTPAEHPDSNYCHSVMDIWKSPDFGKNYDVFQTDKKVYLGDDAANCYNVNGEMYMQADELQKFGTVEWNPREDYNQHEYVGRNLRGNNLKIDLQSDAEGIRFWDFPDDYTGFASHYYFFANRSSTYGYCQYKDGKKNGIGYYMCYYMEAPLSTVYEAGEYEDDKLKNGIQITNDGKGITLIMYEVKDFEKIQLYPKE